MFRRISITIALQFTAFVFLLFLVNGALFLAADLGNARRQTQFRLARAMDVLKERPVMTMMEEWPADFAPPMPPRMREHVRILDAGGNAVYSSGFFTDLPLGKEEGISRLTVQNEQYAILTAPIVRDGRREGTVQIAELERFQREDVLTRALLYLLVSAGISGLTFLVGLAFAERSLRPVKQMVERLEQFTQDASHELRTPLAALSSSLDLALKSKKYREGILSAKEDLRQVAALAERLLDLARLDRFTIDAASVDFSGLVGEAVRRHSAQAAEKHLAIESSVTPGVTVHGDAALLRQVLANLLMNAVKFSTARGGTIRIRLTRDALVVADEGVGIAKRDLPHVFDRFYQAEHSRSHGGFGLGLALVKRIVELHGWKIFVQSKEGKGTAFTVSFPSQS